MKEAVEIGEALSAKVNNQDCMYSAVHNLSFAYKALGEIEKAVKTANKLPLMSYSKEETLVHILEGAELKTHSQNLLVSLIQPLNNMAVRSDSCGYDNKQIIQIYQKAIQIIKLLFENGDYGAQHSELRRWYMGAATSYAKMNDVDAVIENLIAAAEHAITYDLLDENMLHTSLLFSEIKIQKNGKTCMNNESHHLINGMDNECFNFCRNDERFVEIRNRVMAVACKE